MTLPKIETVYRGGSRYYIHPETGESVPGVTSILNMEPKPYLTAWAAKMTAELAAEIIDVLPEMVARDRAGAIDFLKGASKRFTKEAADIGTAAHGIFERMALGETVGDVGEQMTPFKDHFADFLATVKPVFHHVEATVWNSTYGYAGSFDAIASIDGKPVVLDFKTTRSGVHDSTAWQIAAYRRGEVLLEDSGRMMPMPETVGGAVVHVRPEGWALVPVNTDEDAFADFLAMREQHRRLKEDNKRTLVGRPAMKGAAK
jgi:hypothetical protein